MKCYRCDHDSKYKEREGGVCPKCRGTFAFEPQKGDPFTDVGFAKAIEAVSGHGTVRFDVSHLYYELARRKKGSALQSALQAIFWLGGALAALSAVAAVTIALLGLGHVVPDVLAIGAAAGLASGAAWMAGRARGEGVSSRLSAPTFRASWERWQSTHGTPPGLITRSRKGIPMRSAALEEELRAYSFDRAVICDTPAVVDVLVANRFHFENNCAVLSVGGYPESAFETVRAMLRNNPKLLVLTVHDASPEGCTLAHRLSTDPAWFAGQARVVDVGLRPAHARFFEGLVQNNDPLEEVAVAPGITAAEAAWLRKHRLETAAIRPEQLIKRLYKAMLHAEAGGFDASGDGGWVIFGMDTGTTDGGGDSFG